MTKEQSLYTYILRIADTNLIHGQRLAEWCGHGPFLEEDLALTNIALDIIGQSQALYQYAAELNGNGKSEDDLVFHRHERQYYNAFMAELPKGDFGFTILRAYLLSVYNFHLYSALTKSTDNTIAAIASKSIKEVSYHVRHTGAWIERLGDGTQESHDRIQSALNELWRFTSDLFASEESDLGLINDGTAVDFKNIESTWLIQVREKLTISTLHIPQENNQQHGSRKGKHTEHLGYMLAEMQYIPRAYPDAKW
jgi:ring-1,2-phenylacetyl-CoA epoxidase subunit PaaC